MEKKYFGVMLDMSRNAVMKPEQVKKFAKVNLAYPYRTCHILVTEIWIANVFFHIFYSRFDYGKGGVLWCVGMEFSNHSI